MSKKVLCDNFGGSFGQSEQFYLTFLEHVRVYVRVCVCVAEG